jgi:uncharacterized protein YjbI with pentapeptide repeats
VDSLVGDLQRRYSRSSLRATSSDSGSRTILETWSGLAAILAGILIMALTVLLVILARENLWSARAYIRGVSLLLVATPILLLAIALLGLQSRQTGRPARLRWVGFVLAMGGVVTLTACVALFGLLEVFGGTSDTNWPVESLAFVTLGAAGASVMGFTVFGIATAKANVFPRWAAVTIAAGPLLGIALAVLINIVVFAAFADTEPPTMLRTFSWLALFAGLGTFAVGLMRLGYALWAHAHLRKISKRLPDLRKPISLRSSVPRAGLGDKTIWDWLQLLVIPIMLAVASFWFALQQDTRQQATEEQRAQDTALQAYFDKIGELMLSKTMPLRDATEGSSEVRTLARSRTLTVLQRVDRGRKGQIIQFLTEANLVQSVDGRDPVVALSGADLSDAPLHKADLSGNNLSNADLSGANLSRANLSDADLGGADLRGADLSDADLSETDLRDADLSSAGLLDAEVTTLTDANLNDADLRSANLTGANLGYANLSGANLGSDVTYEDLLHGDNLDFSDMDEANLSGANLSGANISGADLSETVGITTDTLERQVLYIGLATMPKHSTTVHAGWYEATEFKPLKEFEVSDEWKPSINAETPDILTMGNLGGHLMFTKALQVFGPSNLNKPKELSKRENVDEWITWFKTHPSLDTSKPDAISIRGRSGKQIDVTVSSPLKSYPRDLCFDEPCVPLYKGSTSASISRAEVGWKYRLVILNVDGETVIIEVAAPADDFDAFLPKAQKVLTTVKWR